MKNIKSLEEFINESQKVTDSRGYALKPGQSVQAIENFDIFLPGGRRLKVKKGDVFKITEIDSFGRILLAGKNGESYGDAGFDPDNFEIW